MARTTIRQKERIENIKKDGLVEIEYDNNTLQLTMSRERFLTLLEYFNTPENFEDVLNSNGENCKVSIFLFMPTSEV